MIIRESSKLARLGGPDGPLHWYCETRPHQVKRLGFEPEGQWAVGPTPERRVRWLFQLEADQCEFCRRHRGFLLIAGYLGPLQTETRRFK